MLEKQPKFNDTIKIGALYSYVFEGIKKLKNLRLSESQKKLISEEIYHQFSAITLTIDEEDDEFRATLLALKAFDIEQLIFGGVQWPCTQQASFPNDNEIKQKFQNLNTHYQFFQEAEKERTEAVFIMFFKACKLAADFIEQNNTPDDGVAALHAYKLLVLFGVAKLGSNPFGKIDAYLKPLQSMKTILHDALVFSIPVNKPPIPDMVGWQELIFKYGMKAIKIFSSAQEINKVIQRAPVDLDEAEKILSMIEYKRAAEYPELAQLCAKYHLSERIFNQCLEINKRRKTFELIPNVHIDGNNYGLSGYHLIKIPIDDPHPYLLGHLTNCCQSIGGHSEQCVIDGITLPENGFYILLKGDDKKGLFNADSSLNYDAFKLLGQGYVWLSDVGNVGFDSWENLRDEDNPIAVAMLKAWAKKVTELHPTIHRVVIGNGGKTPAGFGEKARVAEKMANGTQYGDSKVQRVICYSSAYEKLCEDLGLSEGKNILFEPSIVNRILNQNEDVEILINYLMNHVDKQGDSFLMYAVQGAQITLVKDLIDKGINVHLLNKSSESALIVAVKLGYFDIVALLIEQGAAVNFREGYCRESPLMFAAQSDNDSLVQLLLDKGAEVNYSDEQNNTPLLCAVIAGKVKNVKLLLERGANIHASNKDKKTAFLLALESKSPELIKLLLAHGADKKTVNIHGKIPITMAAHYPSTKCVIALLESGFDVNETDENGETALMQAAITGNIFMIELLLAKNANVNHISHAKQTALMFAIEYDYKKIIQLLLEKNADINESLALAVYSSDRNYVCSWLINHKADLYQSLLIAIKMDLPDAVYNLLKNKIKINKVDENGNTPLMLAIIQGNPAIIQLILHKEYLPPDVHTVNNAGDTPLMLAIRLGNPEIIQWILERSVGIYPSFMLAIKKNDLPIVKFFFEQDKTIINDTSRNDTALTAAAKKGHDTLVQWLIEQGADRKHSILLAAHRGDKDVIASLIKNNVCVHGHSIHKEILEVVKMVIHNCDANSGILKLANDALLADDEQAMLEAKNTIKDRLNPETVVTRSYPFFSAPGSKPVDRYGLVFSICSISVQNNLDLALSNPSLRA